MIIITGANTGLGYIATEELAKLGPATIIMACRDRTRGEEAVRSIKTSTKTNCVEFMEMDLDDLDSVKRFCTNFSAKYSKLDTLMMNAGIMALPERDITLQGFEKQFGVNHIGHFLLAKLLLDKIKASPEGRIVVLSSNAHKRGSNTIRFDDMAHETSYEAFVAYSMSKLSNVYFTRYLAKELEDEGVTHVKVVSLHPGVVRTELGRYMMTGLKKVAFLPLYPVMYLCMKPVWYGA